MDYSKNFIKNLLKKYRIRPLKYMGQNFLVDKAAFRKIIKAANLSKNDTVLEIGPGIGNLTRELAKKVKKVIAVEKDKRMVEILKKMLKDFKNVKIIQGDILKILDSQFPILNSNLKIVANLPYYLTSAVIRKLLENPPRNRKPKEIILMVQKEVAQRICSSEKMNLFALSIQFYAKPEIISFVSKNCFWPKPKVDSAIIKIKSKRLPPSQSEILKKKDENKLFFKLIKAGFAHPRKKVLRNLERGLKLNREKVEKIFKKNKINFNLRAENLSLKDWLLLWQDFKSLLK